MAELQKDPITRKDLLGLGVLGAVVGAILTIPPAAFVLGPVIRTDVLGETNVSNDRFKAGSIEEVPAKEPQVFEVEFPIDQAYAGDVQKAGPQTQRSQNEFTVKNAIWVSWKTEILPDGSYGESLRPAFLSGGVNEPLNQEQIQEVQETLNVLSNSCAHLGCPVRWFEAEGVGEFRCPCHGGIYNINGSLVSGPPPRGMYSYTSEVREDGNIYVKHEFDVGGGLNEQAPFVI